MMLFELKFFFVEPILTVKFVGHTEEIGYCENEEVYSYFGLHEPVSSINDDNDSTDAVDGDFNNRDDSGAEFNLSDDMHICDSPNPDDQIPPEYASDPDLWRAIQMSMVEANDERDEDFENPTDNEVGIGGLNDASFNVADPIIANNDLQDIVMGNDDIKKKTKTPSTGACTPDNFSIKSTSFSNKNNMSFDDDVNMNIVREIQDGDEQGGDREPRKTNRELAAERRVANADRFKLYQEKATKQLKDRKVVKLRTKPLPQLKDCLKRLSEDFNFNFRGIDGSIRCYLGKGKIERDVSCSTQETSSILKKFEK